jgi:hypothetical protein
MSRLSGDSMMLLATLPIRCVAFAFSLVTREIESSHFPADEYRLWLSTFVAVCGLESWGHGL